jgi:putative nucleotidyltransferase with HDIG domain
MMIPTTQNTVVVETVMRDLSRLRPLPSVVMQVIQLLANPQVDINRVGQMLVADQVIAAQILRQANSAYYGGRAPCATVADGIVRVGIRQVKSVLYGAAANQMLSAHLQMKNDLFRHSQVVAAVARRLAALLHRADPEEAFTAGLLHDIGKLLLERHARPHYHAMAEMIQQGYSLIHVGENFWEPITPLLAGSSPSAGNSRACWSKRYGITMRPHFLISPNYPRLLSTPISSCCRRASVSLRWASHLSRPIRCKFWGSNRTAPTS